MAAGDLLLYDPDQIVIVVAGIPIDGFADGEFIRIERDNNAFDDVVGTSGEVTRSKTNDHRRTITLRLMYTSRSNALLSALFNSDLNAPGGVGVGAFMLQDLVSGTTMIAEKCWIAKDPDDPFDRTANEREWLIRVARLDKQYGAQ